MIVSYADKLGREMGINGVWGNLGVASSALVTGVVGQFLGWRWAFIVPGIVTLLIGVAFMRASSTRTAPATSRPRRRRGSRKATCGGGLALLIWRSRFDHLQRGDGGAAKAVRRAIVGPDREPGAARCHRCLRLCHRRDDAVHHWPVDRRVFAEDGLPAAVASAGAVAVFRGDVSDLPLIVVAIGIVWDLRAGHRQSTPWWGITPARSGARAPMRCVFIGFTAAGASVGVVAWLYRAGRIATMLHSFAALCLLVIVAAFILPPEIAVPAAAERVAGCSW